MSPITKKVVSVSLVITIILLLVALILKIDQSNQRKNEVVDLNIKMDQKEKEVSLYKDIVLAYEKYFKDGDGESLLRSYDELATAVEDENQIEERKEKLKEIISDENKPDTSSSRDQLRAIIQQNNRVVAELDSQIITLKKRNNKQLDSMSNRISKLKDDLESKSKMLDKKEKIQALTFLNSKGNTVHYLGEVSNGKANGGGTGIYTTGSIYKGQWKNNQRHGKGEFKWPDGQKYIGEYKNDKREGQGEYHWPSNERYEGEWKNDRRNGYGTLYDENDNVLYEGEWINDEPK